LLYSIETQTEMTRNVGTLRCPPKTLSSCRCHKDQESEKFNKFVRLEVNFFGIIYTTNNSYIYILYLYNVVFLFDKYIVNEIAAVLC